MPRVKRASVAKAESADVDYEDVERLGVKPFQRIVLGTPETHTAFELSSLPTAPASSEQPPMPWEDTPEALALFKKLLGGSFSADAILDKIVKRTPEECDEEAKHPQRSEGWFKARAFALTASSFGSAAAQSPHMSPAKLLYSKIYTRGGFTGNSFTQWGVEHEKDAEEAFKTQFLTPRCMSNLEHPSFIKNPEKPWLGFSPDAVLKRHENGQCITELVEYKCPAYNRNLDGYPYAKYKYGVPPHYMAQIQGSMALMRMSIPNVSATWFCVWQPHRITIICIPFMPNYSGTLEGKLRKFYFDKFLPSCVDAAKAAEKRHEESIESHLQTT